jgi:transcriptional regulator with PAS, ATPase and Fis domain
MTENVTLSEATARLERTLISHALRRAANSRTEAAKSLGVSRRTLQYKLKEYFPDGFS